MTFDTYIGKLDYLLGVHYIFVPSHILKKLGGIKSGRWVCYVAKETGFQCGFVSLGNGNAYITINKTRLKKLNLKVGSEISVRLEKDQSEFGIDMCEELSTLLDQDIEGNQRFRELRPGMQRALIYYVGMVKNPQLRIDRSILIIGNLKNTSPGKETFRALLGKSQ